MKLIYLSNYSAELWLVRENIDLDSLVPLSFVAWASVPLITVFKRVSNMDCFYQANQRIRPPSYFNSPPIMYGYGVPSYYSPPFFPLGRNSEIHMPPGASTSPPLRAANPVTNSENRTSPVSTASQSPPESPSESSTHETNELSDEPCQSGKDASESEDKTGERR